MPWKDADADGKTKKADTPKKRRMWANIANTLLADGASEAQAIREANGVIAKQSKKGK